jgi:putative N6-adenine-specific DNA methylase
MYAFRNKSRIVVTCAKGINPFLKEELEALGYGIKNELTAGLETEGTMKDAMRLNLFLRTGSRVLFQLARFRAAGPDELYKEVKQLPWEDMLDPKGYFSITSSVLNDNIRDTRFANLRCKDAIADRMTSKLGKRPNTGPELNAAVLFLHWREDECALYIDTSGEALSKRGYRYNPMMAPMTETLAAAVIMKTGWKGTDNFINPMCGSGTLAIEALMSALNMAGGIIRRNFGFMHITGFNKKEWSDMRNDALRVVKKDIKGQVIVSDHDERCLKAVEENAGYAGVEKYLDYQLCDFRDCTVPEGGGTVILNPEYGKRLGDEKQLESVYGAIGDFFKSSCQGYKGYIFTGNMELAKHVGLRTASKTVFFNSKIECRLLEYELYKGTKKHQDKDEA